MKIVTSRLFCLLSLPLVLAACTQQDVYEISQENARKACEKEPPAMQDQCREQYRQSYAEYQRDREELLKDDK
ncbi:hypothetical protein [Pseudoteredinibacter isoporae]|uniref:Outer membrane lipoprotein-sorting protein n=1 Tax=Pseudoteredinibacter isoporae TaxID=570281 RepID=A0A7X0JY78_9GAMM|nr:hypothetical protein [Pseudoteredinibacter isoporae]MBB6523735.1 outer membrane lipoprotein-sorting protein [Pseudoteredinibacter isoporae]NHO89237.1 hypothetical protein [Pseudoteredinibacter isoporae]NIB22152.1 hypothetical protein [Pseudoteredinibacter isoporae]